MCIYIYEYINTCRVQLAAQVPTYYVTFSGSMYIYICKNSYLDPNSL